MCFGSTTSRPQGYSNIKAIAMPLIENSNMACRMFGDSSFTITGGITVETLACDMLGEGTMVTNASGAITMYCNMLGEGTFTGTPRVLENMTCTMDAGVRPSAFDIAQEIWQSQASAYNAAGTMGNRVNAAGAAGDPWGIPLPGSYVAGSAGYILASVKINTDLIPAAL